ncbi:alpha/beta-hydrolase [Astrocystis sublimbata]|nr:alpha/beta-hydrolase [Astrocystis sublimbata]
MAASLRYTLHHYGSHNDLQKLGVWEAEPADKGKYWVVYIHGGAWRDPRVAHETFVPSIDHILSLSPASSTSNGVGAIAIAGFASIDYRLSPHPDFPQDPATTPTNQYRGARHPDHLDDVRSALVFLQQTYGFGANYVLVGHSAGAALAFQLVATSSPLTGTPGASTMMAGAPAHPVLPVAIVAFGGLYDFTAVNERFGGTYASFFRSAFGDADDWDAAAPIKFPGSYAEQWSNGEFVLLGWSPEDTLVDEPEADNMARRIRDIDGFVEGVGDEEAGKKRLLLFKDLRGDHDDIWRNGEGVARMVWIALQKLGFEP